MAQIEMRIMAPTDKDITDGLESLKTDNKGGDFLARWTIDVDPDFIRNTLVPRISGWPRIDLAKKESSHTTGHLLLEAMFYVVNNGTLDPTLEHAKSLFKRSVHVEKKTTVLERSLWHHRAAFNHHKLYMLSLIQKKDPVSTAAIKKLTKKIPYMFSIASILPDNAIKLLIHFTALERTLRAASAMRTSQTFTTMINRASELDLLTDEQKQEYDRILNDPKRSKSEKWLEARTDTSSEKKQLIQTLMTESIVSDLREFLKGLKLTDSLKTVFNQNEEHFAALDGIYKQLSDCYQKTIFKTPGLAYFHWMIGHLYGAPGISIYQPEASIEAFRAGAQLGDLRCQAEYTQALERKMKDNVEVSAQMLKEAFEWNLRVMNCSLEMYMHAYTNNDESGDKEQRLRIEWLDFVSNAAILHHTLLLAPVNLDEDGKVLLVNAAIAKLNHLSDQFGHLKSITFLMKHNLALAAAGLTSPENVALQFKTYASAARLVMQNPNADVNLKLEYRTDIKVFRDNYAQFIPDEANYQFGWILDTHYYENFLYRLKAEATVFTDENIADYNGAIYLFLKDPFLDNRIPGVIAMKKQLVIAAAVKPGFKITENIDDLNQNKLVSQFLYESLRELIARTAATRNVETVITMLEILSAITPAAPDIYMATLSLKQQVLSRQLQLLAPLLEADRNNQELKAQSEELTRLVDENNKRLQPDNKLKDVIKKIGDAKKAPSE
jgi:hypothetical protein